MNARHPSNEDPNRDPWHGDTTDPGDDSPDVPFTIGPLVDDLSRGAPPPDDDELARLLAGWRDDITAGLETSTPTTPCTATPDDHVAPVLALNRRTRPRGRWFRTLTASAATFVLLATGLAFGSWHTTPASPLWPVTEVLYPDHADVVAIEYTIRQARDALNHHLFDQAGQLINQARHELAESDLPARTAARLRAQIDQLVLDLAHAVADITRPTRTPTTRPTAPATTTPATTAPASPAPNPSSPAPEPTVVPDGVIPKLPLPPLLPSPSTSPSPSPSPSPSSGGGLCLLPLLPCIGEDSDRVADGPEPSPSSSGEN